MLCFILLGLALLSIWIQRDPKIWFSLLFLSMLLAMANGILLPIGVLAIFLWALLWFFFVKKQNAILFLLLVLGSYLFIFNFIPGFEPFMITQKLRLGFKSVVGLFPLALWVPVATSRRDWAKAFNGFLFGCLGIGFMAILAITFNAAQPQIKLPPFPWIVYLNNLVLVAIPEEAFFRGFIQNQLFRYWNNKTLSLILTSILFALGHIYWSPNLLILTFVFLAGLLYGGVYLISQKIESAILTHFLLNFIHITFFTYHAL